MKANLIRRLMAIEARRQANTPTSEEWAEKVHAYLLTAPDNPARRRVLELLELARRRRDGLEPWPQR